MDALDLMRQFLKTGDRFRRLDFGTICPGITQGEFAVLNRIRVNSRQYGEIYGAHISDIVRDMEIAPPGLSRILRTLEEKGAVYRESDRMDRRNICVCLTPKGKQIHKEGHEKLMGFAQACVEHMGEERMREMIGLWNQLADVMQTELAAYRKD